MIEKVEGIIVSETPYGETSKIINIFTKEYGIIGVIAKGAKSMKSSLRAVTSKFTYGYFNIYYKKGRLSQLKSVDTINSLINIKTDIVLLGYMSYISELITQVYKQSESKELYQMYVDIVLKLNDKKDPLVLSNIIEIKCLDYLGIGLNLNGCINCGNQKNIVTIDPDQGGYICQECYQGEKIVDPKIIKMLRMYYLVEIKSITDLKINEDTKNQINYFLSKYYDRYTGLYLKSKDFLTKYIVN